MLIKITKKGKVHLNTGKFQYQNKITLEGVLILGWLIFWTAWETLLWWIK